MPVRKRAHTVDATFPATLRLPPPFYLNELKDGPGVPEFELKLELLAESATGAGKLLYAVILSTEFGSWKDIFSSALRLLQLLQRSAEEGLVVCHRSPPTKKVEELVKKLGPNWKAPAPDLGLYQCMHVKGWLLVFEQKATLCLGTGNARDVEQTVATNGWHVVEFPRKVAGGAVAQASWEKSLATLCEHLATRGVATKRLLRHVRGYDYSSSLADLVVTVPDSLHPGAAPSFSHLQIRDVLASQNPPLRPASRLVMACSSLGASLADKVVPEVLSSLRGGGASSAAESGLTVLWPTVARVDACLTAAMLFPNKRDKVEAALTAPHHLLRLCPFQSAPGLPPGPRTTSLAHMKSIISISVAAAAPPASPLLEYVLLCSHNLSGAALGATTSKGTTTCGNFEAEMLFTPSRVASGLVAQARLLLSHRLPYSRFTMCAESARWLVDLADGGGGALRVRLVAAFEAPLVGTNVAGADATVERAGGGAVLTMKVPLPFQFGGAAPFPTGARGNQAPYWQL